jgi:hypothetical protein
MAKTQTATTIHADGTYGIDTGDGNQLCAGLSWYDVARTAQRLADDRGEAVYVYEIGAGDRDDDGTAPEVLEFRPSGGR